MTGDGNGILLLVVIFTTALFPCCFEENKAKRGRSGHPQRGPVLAMVT